MTEADVASRKRRDERGASAEQLNWLLKQLTDFPELLKEFKTKPEKAVARCNVVLSPEQFQILRKHYDTLRQFAEMREDLEKHCKVVRIAILS